LSLLSILELCAVGRPEHLREKQAKSRSLLLFCPKSGSDVKAFESLTLLLAMFAQSHLLDFGKSICKRY